jgi:hypothetical protein
VELVREYARVCHFESRYDGSAHVVLFRVAISLKCLLMVQLPLGMMQLTNSGMVATLLMRG